MSRRIATVLTLNILIAIGAVTTLLAQAPAGAGAAKAKGKGATATPGKAVAPRAGLFFREEWKQNANGGEEKLTQANVANPDLELHVYGCGGPEGLLMTGFDNNDANPTHTWTGVCEGASMFTLSHKTKFADLSPATARVRVNAKTSGFHKLRPVVKTSEGVWMIGNVEIGTNADFLVTEMNFSEVKWWRMNAKTVLPTGNALATVDLTSIDEFGFADLLAGSGHGPGGWGDVAQIELYANSKPRE
jgi:hypothetical protein